MHTDPIGYFITWTCYGTRLPGDRDGWTHWRVGMQLWEPLLENWCRDQMKEQPVLLDRAQRDIVENVIDEHCKHRRWTLHAVNCRTNHCHVVATAPDYEGKQARDHSKPGPHAG